MMKTCPICNARCFDDMETCFGCMHRFDGEVPSEQPTEKLEIPIIEAAGGAGEATEPCSTAVEDEERVLRIPMGAQEKSPLAAGYQLVISFQPMSVG